MAIVASKLGSQFRQMSAAALQGALVAAGIDDARFVLGAEPQDAPSCEAGVFSDPSHRNHYWIRTATGSVEYLVQEPSTDFSPLGIPFFLADFKLAPSDLLDPNVGTHQVQQRLRPLGIDFAVKVGAQLPPDEGTYLVPGPQGLAAYFTDRGHDRLLFETRFAWVAGLAIAWSGNYKKLQFT